VLGVFDSIFCTLARFSVLPGHAIIMTRDSAEKMRIAHLVHAKDRAPVVRVLCAHCLKRFAGTSNMRKHVHCAPTSFSTRGRLGDHLRHAHDFSGPLVATRLFLGQASHLPERAWRRRDWERERERDRADEEDEGHAEACSNAWRHSPLISAICRVSSATARSW